jgi:hypothetical protein
MHINKEPPYWPQSIYRSIRENELPELMDSGRKVAVLMQTRRTTALPFPTQHVDVVCGDGTVLDSAQAGLGKLYIFYHDIYMQDVFVPYATCRPVLFYHCRFLLDGGLNHQRSTRYLYIS